MSLTFDETTAVCEASCRGDKSTDYIKATLTLYQGSTYVTSWNGEGSYRAIVSGQRSVTRGKSYTLKLNYTINGVAQPEQSVKKVCRYTMRPWFVFLYVDAKGYPLSKILEQKKV